MIHCIVQPKKITIGILIHLEMIGLKTQHEIWHLIQFQFDLITPIQNHFQKRDLDQFSFRRKIE